MNPPYPTLFLSHSGEQKRFVRHLYQELQHVNHSTFFDEDSGIDGLPKGSPFPSRIVKCCRECKLGIVVLSHDYIESLWPMLELQEFIFHNRNAPHNVYPIFYELKPADLDNEKNQRRWKSTWQKNEASWRAKVQNSFMEAPSTSTSDPQPTLEIELWPVALKMLRSRSEDILYPNNKDELSFIQTIVSNICKRFPPRKYFEMGSYFKGADHITQEIHKLFQEEEESKKENDFDRDTPVVVGMHGVGGSGKSTACNYMVNFYGKDYPGNCFCLELPSRDQEAESKSLVQSIKNVLSTRGLVAKEHLDSVQSVDQAMPYLKVFLRSYKVFLILDNVWDWAVPIVKQILTMEFVPESRLLVTSRSSRLLEILTKEEATILSAMKIIPITSMSEEEAIQALMDYSCTTWYFNSRVDDLRGLARSCFFDGQCHPLLLIKGVGAKLRRLGGHKHSDQQWAQLISDLQADIKHGNGDIEKSVVRVLKTSYEQLDSDKLKDVFLKLGTCTPQYYLWHNNAAKLCEWLAMISSDGFPSTVENIRFQLIELEYYGLIEMQNDEVKLHDLQRMLIDNLWQENEGEPRRCLLFEGDENGISTAASEISDDEWRRFKYIFAKAENSMICEIRERRWPSRCFFLHRRACMSPRWQCIEVLHLQEISYRESAREVKSADVRLSVKHMASLRHLVLRGLKKLIEVGGWHGASKLTSVKLIDCGLQKVESMACLTRLESLVISSSNFGRKGRNILKGANDLAEFLGHLPELRELDLSGCRNNWVNLGRLSDICPSLQRCNLSWAGICKFPSLNLIQLRVLDLGNCDSLQSMEGSMCSLTALEELCLDDCRKLERIPDLKLLVSLRALGLRGCCALKEVKVGGAAPLTSLELRGCYALTEVKVGDAAVTSLKCLSLERETCCHLSTESCSPLPISAFTNLQRLTVLSDSRRGELIFRMDLPVSLEHLELHEFAIDKGIARLTSLTSLLNLKRLSLYGCASLTSIDHGLPSALQELHVCDCASLKDTTGLSALPDLRKLTVASCASLTSITGLGPLTKLESLRISGCESLRVVGHWEPSFDRYKLRDFWVNECPQLDTSVFPSHIRNMIT